jgi:FkbM family methyltransferase
MKAKSLLRRIQMWGYSNGFLRNIWRKVVPAGVRRSITRYTMARDEKLKFEAFAKSIVQGIENNSISFDKSAEVLRFLKTHPDGMRSPDFLKIWLEGRDGPELCFNFNGAKLPYVEDGHSAMCDLNLFSEIFLIHVLFNDNYGKDNISLFENNMLEDPYGYTDDAFDVSVKADDTVIDAGSFIGDFAAYAAARGAFTYAFEPADTTFEFLKKAAELNGGKIFPVKKGLGNIDGEVEMFIDDENPSGNTISIIRNTINEVIQGDVSNLTKKRCNISIVTLDNFVCEQNIKKIDFIKADIEGAERDMLRGAKNVLREFAPKLAICTYHLPDDPEVLENLILETNPKYRVRQGPKKLYAAVI